MNSSVLEWPDAETVHEAVVRWAAHRANERPETTRIGYFGSYARGDWGVGSDLDVIIVVDHSSDAFESRARAWDATPLPVPADVLVYTADEWADLVRERGRFARMIEREAVWVYERG